MFKKGKSILGSILIIGLIGSLGFKDTGIFVKDYLAQEEDNTEISFEEGETVNILGERDREYILERDSKKYYVPKDVVLKLETDLEDGKSEKVITIGTAQVDKTIKGDNNTYYVLLKGETVLVTNFSEGKFTIVDEDGTEFKVPRDYISLRNSRHATSRAGNITGRTSKINAVVSGAHKALGSPYRSGGTGEGGYDCSGLTYAMYLNHAGIKLNRSSRAQVKNGVGVKKSELIPGDIVLFRASGKDIGHAGLYIGDGKMIHASSGRGKVIITPIDQAWYKKRYVTARRIIK